MFGYQYRRKNIKKSLSTKLPMEERRSHNKSATQFIQNMKIKDNSLTGRNYEWTQLRTK
jgi:hypothetical protein